MKKKKQFAVIGLGHFGSSVATTLYNLGFEVLAIDTNEQRIQEHMDHVTHAVQADATDEDSLRAIGIRNFDVIVVAIGADIQASILTTLILKELGALMLIVKAQNELHGKVLRKIGADKVIFPERDMGQRVAHHLISPNILDFIELSDDYSMIEMRVASHMVGKNLRQLHIRATYQCNVIAIKNADHMNISPSAEDIIKADDILVVLGDNDHLKNFEMSMLEAK